MWEGRPIDFINGWPIFGNDNDNTGISMSTSMIMNCNSPKLISKENHTNSLQHPRRSERDKASCKPDQLSDPDATANGSSSSVSWQLLSVTLHRIPKVGFGIAVSSGRENPNFTSGDPTVIVSDVIPTGPAWGLVQVNDCILSANGVALETADYAEAIKIMKESQQLNMIVKRRVPVPHIEYEQRTLKFTLSKSRKKEDFGIILGCKFYIKEITNRKLAEKDPGLREGDTVLRINGQSVEGVTIEEATKWLSKSREKLSLVVQRDVRRDSSRWPSQNTVYERLGSVSGTPRHSPSPMHNLHQSLAPRSSLEYVNTSTMSNARWSQSERQSIDYGDFHRRNGSITNSQSSQSDVSIRTIRFRKIGGSLGVRVIGGNQVGIFVSAVQEDSPAAIHSIRSGDRILSVNEKSMIGVTREEAVRHLLALHDDVTIKVEYSAVDYERIRNGPLGDNFYIRTHFAHQKTSNHLELSFHSGDIFHITDTLFGGTVGFWQATRVYSAAENGNYIQNDNNKGVIPNSETAEKLAKATRNDTSTFGRSTFFRRKLKERRTKSLTKNVIDDVTFENACDMTFPAYERVTLRHPQFQRPLVLFGPLADIARQRLLANFAVRFAGVIDESIVRLSAIDAVIAANKHCVLDISPGSVERLQLAQYAPIVIFIDVESRSRIRELRSKAGAPTISSKKLSEQAHKIKKHYSYLLTATLDATKEDGWFEALLQLISHLQDRRVWMPEFRPLTNLNDVILLPMHSFQNQSDSDIESLKGDYSTNEYFTKSQLQLENSDPLVKSGFDPQLSTYDPQYPGPLRSVQSHLVNYPPPPSPATASSSATATATAAGMLASRSNFYQNVHPCEPLSQYSSRVQLSTSSVNPITAQHSPFHRNCYVDMTPATTLMPWVTLPRRHNSHGVDTFPATTKDSSSLIITNNSNRPMDQSQISLTNSGMSHQLTSMQQHSPILQQRQRNVMQSGSPRLTRNAQKLPVKVSPPRSPISFTGYPTLTARDSTTSAVISTSNSNTTTTNVIADISNNRRVSHINTSGTINTNANTITTGPIQAGFSGAKQILAEGTEEYPTGGTREMVRSHVENVDNSSSSSYNANNSVISGHDMMTMMHSGRTGLFYDHLTRDRWVSNQSEKKQNVSSQITHSPFRTSNAPLSSLPRESPILISENNETMHNTDDDSSILRLSHASPTSDLNGAMDRITSADNSDITKKEVIISSDPNATVIEHSTAIIDARGGRLNCPKTGVSLIIPEGAINEGIQQEIYVKVCRASDAGNRPPLDESRGESLMSPLVMCGPQNLQFNIPVELRLPHSVSNSSENWSLALKSGTGQQWDQVSLDKNTSSVVTDHFVSLKINHF
ncbi:PDZ domain (Also known as DHR or GLGF) family protein [Brugia pahangi]